MVEESHSRVTVSASIVDFIVNPGGELVLKLKFRFPSWQEKHRIQELFTYINFSDLVKKQK